MLFLFVLVAAYAALWPLTRGRLTVRSRARVALAAGMVVAGAAHLVTPTPFVQHLPEIVPLREAIVFASGLVEIAFGFALVGPARWRPLIGLLLAGYLVAVFPGNVYVAVAGVDVEGQPGGIYSWLRLPLQAVFVWLAIATTGAMSALPTRFVPDRLRQLDGLPS
ncbi:MAG TPA: hypothetical protein VLA44_06185 [Clostridia bacterium]|nr:hypothetical protein [Clostridia bacterium]